METIEIIAKISVKNKKLSNLMNDVNLDFTKLSYRTGISRRLLYRIGNLHGTCTSPTVIKLAKYFKVDPFDIIDPNMIEVAKIIREKGTQQSVSVDATLALESAKNVKYISSTFDDICGKDDKKKIQDVMDQVLSEREIGVISMRFGVNQPCKTLEAVGLIYGVTRERIRSIEAKALMKLRVNLNIDMFNLDLQ